jgi:hypothetical protein
LNTSQNIAQSKATYLLTFNLKNYFVGKHLIMVVVDKRRLKVHEVTVVGATGYLRVEMIDEEMRGN